MSFTKKLKIGVPKACWQLSLHIICKNEIKRSISLPSDCNDGSVVPRRVLRRSLGPFLFSFKKNSSNRIHHRIQAFFLFARISKIISHVALMPFQYFTNKTIGFQNCILLKEIWPHVHVNPKMTQCVHLCCL